ncbi:hypothetical protein C8R45DRAFT_933171 [Mycena sanguinolenta]|nr:hypothetical protein C8R45DRAFT_933171 [Mycena sanguinolenta]
MFGSGVRTPENAEPNLPNLNLRFRFGFREIAEPNRSSGSAFGKKYPEPEPNRTLPSLCTIARRCEREGKNLKKERVNGKFVLSAAIHVSTETLTAPEEETKLGL